MPRLQDRVVIVTGGGHGIGRAYCRAFGKEGAKVGVVDMDGPATERVAEEIAREGGTALPLIADVGKEDETQRMAEAMLQKFGRIDGLVNNAAIFNVVPRQRFDSMEHITLAEWDRVMSVNVAGVFLCCKAVVPQMKSQDYGKIVNISSTQAMQGLQPLTPYLVSKAAVLGITRALARELGRWNITVNSVAPGGTLSTDNVTEEILQAQQAMMTTVRTAGGPLSGVPLRAIRRVQQSDDVVGAVVFLCSTESDFVSGQTLVVDGGSFMN